MVRVSFAPMEKHIPPRPSWCLEAVPRQEKRWLSILSLRAGTVVCGLIATICFAWALSLHEQNIVYMDGLGSSFSSANLGTACYAFTWSIVFLLVAGFFNAKVHPGMTIPFDCIAMIAQAITAILFLYELGYYHPGGYWGGSVRDRLYGVECFACAVMLLGVILHFVLVVRASIVWRKHDKAKPRGPANASIRQ